MRLCYARYISVLSLCLLCRSHPLNAAEVSNLKPTYTSSQLTLEYDLLGSHGEKTSGVEILLDIHGKRYSAHMLTLSGDFGRSIPLGKKRRIVWKHTKDIPEGLDKSFKCIVNAVPDSRVVNEELTPAEGVRESQYAVNRQVVVDRKARLMWTRTAAISPKPMVHAATQKLIAQLNAERFAGYNDWRMPTREDFEALLAPGKHAGWGSGITRYMADYLGTCGFTAVQSGNYWTASPATEQPGYFYAVNTWNGNSRPLEEKNYYYLWPVRGLQP